MKEFLYRYSDVLLDVLGYMYVFEYEIWMIIDRFVRVSLR